MYGKLQMPGGITTASISVFLPVNDAEWLDDNLIVPSNRYEILLDNLIFAVDCNVHCTQVTQYLVVGFLGLGKMLQPSITSQLTTFSVEYLQSIFQSVNF